MQGGGRMQGESAFITEVQLRLFLSPGGPILAGAA